VQQAFETVKEFPPSQKPDSWNLDKLAEQIEANIGKQYKSNIPLKFRGMFAYPDAAADSDTGH